MYFVLALLFIYRFRLQGLGQTITPTLAGVMGLIMRTFDAIIYHFNNFVIIYNEYKIGIMTKL
ncbi:hypothetical protein [Clostridium lacusfryxellense]|uniref:hypothetical protein n=1 Tax=Clostridium lacusfryxellense TaxID=205328 RepID=UPI001C0B5F2B|nr:hypothetical protein [Clostridium lacusfryxellense]MBU3112666.1 hypothetical protein [Clostridium lacusfryxellense]